MRTIRAATFWRWWRGLPPILLDAVLALILLGVSLAEIATNADALRGTPWESVALLCAMSGAVVFRRQYPVGTWVVSGVLAALYGIGPYTDPTLPYGPLLAIYTVAATTSPRVARQAGVVTAIVLVVTLTVDRRSNVLDWLVAGLACATAWLVGNNTATNRAFAQEMRDRAQRLEREERAEAHRAVTQERLRLARELHDVAAHHVSVIALHAEAGQALLPAQPERAQQSFAVIGETARTTLNELRRLLGVWRDDDPVAPRRPYGNLQDLPALVQDLRHAGLPVKLLITGNRRQVSDAVGMSAFRIVQEALTNVIRHAGPACAEVTVRVDPDALYVRVLDDGSTTIGSAPALVPGGHGLAGMGERVALLGGSFSAGRRPEGGFAVDAQLPL